MARHPPGQRGCVAKTDGSPAVSLSSLYQSNISPTRYSKHFEGLKPGLDSGFWKMGGESTSTELFPAPYFWPKTSAVGMSGMLTIANRSTPRRSSQRRRRIKDSRQLHGSTMFLQGGGH